MNVGHHFGDAAREFDECFQAHVERRVVAARVHVGIDRRQIPVGIGGRVMSFLQPVEITLHDVQQVCAIEALARLEEHGIDRRELIALIVQPRDLAPQTMGAQIRKLPVVLVFARERGKGRLGCKVALLESLRDLLPLQARLRGRPLHGRFRLRRLVAARGRGGEQNPRQSRTHLDFQGHCNSPLAFLDFLRSRHRSARARCLEFSPDPVRNHRDRRARAPAGRPLARGCAPRTPSISGGWRSIQRATARPRAESSSVRPRR